MRRPTGWALASIAVCAIGCAHGTAQEQVRLVRGIDWAGRGTWLRAEFHTHTRFSDGAHTVEEVVAAAQRFGCDVVAINDHGDPKMKGGTPEYVDAIRTARQQHPGMVVMTGMEWNVPPGKGQEHATVLFPSAMESSERLLPFKTQYDDEQREGDSAGLAAAGLAALTPANAGDAAPVMFFNHPNRRPASKSLPALTFRELQRQAPRILIGVEGGPGHQKAQPLGAYDDQSKLADRWDRIVAEPGGVWDRWLGEGLTVWGAIASADFHSPNGDFWPCEFSSTWVYAPSRTADGVIQALRAGSFFAEQGRIVDEADLQVAFGARPARTFHAGETVAVRVGSTASVSMRVVPSKVDYLGRENRIDQVELFGTSPAGTETLFAAAPQGETAFVVPVIVPPGGIVLRARGRRTLDDGSALMFYTNPIRVNATP
jgi:hypothetical protein